MTLKQKFCIAAAVGGVLLAAVLAGQFWSGYRIGRIEQEATEAKEKAEVLERRAADAELRAAEYKQKTEYLERSLAQIRATARRQDEELEKLDVDARGARADVERAKRVRAVGATADELCRQLGELGYPCS
jgi:hypothetical protein